MDCREFAEWFAWEKIKKDPDSGKERWEKDLAVMEMFGKSHNRKAIRMKR